MAARALKTGLRKAIKRQLAAISPELLAGQSENLVHAIRALPEYANATTIGLYMAMPHSEVSTAALLADAIGQGKHVYLPRVTDLEMFGDHKRHPRQSMCLHFLRVKSLEEVDRLAPAGKYNLREPEFSFPGQPAGGSSAGRGSAAAPIPSNDLLLTGETLDLLVVPGVAFTAQGYRMGHGVGFYDDFIKRYLEKHGSRPVLMGVGLQEQLVADIPTEKHDEKLDLVVLGDGRVLETGKKNE